jgi:hypothetical protein
MSALHHPPTPNRFITYSHIMLHKLFVCGLSSETVLLTFLHNILDKSINRHSIKKSNEDYFHLKILKERLQNCAT